ncbi:TPA: hypothetical protein QDE31_01590 [Burkholderia cenocepacia]|nr:hypothetical protein [Burkholderia cenocepacia]
MAFQIVDRVKETTTTTGTGALSLGGAATGFNAFSSACADQDTCHYALQAVDGSGNPTGDWEVGLGTYNSSGNTLSRTTIYSSSNSNAAVNLSSGTKQVWIGMPAELLRLGAFLSMSGAPANIPKTSSFAWTNQGSCTATQQANGIAIYAPSQAGENVRVYDQAKPGGSSWAVVAQYELVGQKVNYSRAGLAFRDSASGKIVPFWIGLWEQSYDYEPYTNTTTFGSRTQVTSLVGAIARWQKITYDSTNFKWYLSNDGVTWALIYTISVSNFFTSGAFTHVGVALNPYSGDIAMNLYQFSAG